ncbi:MAG: hypothetical protein EOO71_21800 [Myxococcaceae bacterium]|nr:MAG: hypothetical protein EOO71_21800 [Myxococcaceae bacterium]
MLPFIIGAAAAGGLYLLLRNEHPKAFISFAVEDDWYRTCLVGQAKNEKVRFKINDKSLHEPFDERWKTQAREIIKNCDLMIVMIGKSTYKADGVLWEIKAGLEEDIPIFGIHINKSPPSRVPQIMRENKIKALRWEHSLIHREIQAAMKIRTRT